MQKFEFLWQPLLGELAISRKKEIEKERQLSVSNPSKNAQSFRPALSWPWQERGLEMTYHHKVQEVSQDAYFWMYFDHYPEGSGFVWKQYKNHKGISCMRARPGPPPVSTHLFWKVCREQYSVWWRWSNAEVLTILHSILESAQLSNISICQSFTISSRDISGRATLWGGNNS